MKTGSFLLLAAFAVAPLAAQTGNAPNPKLRTPSRAERTAPATYKAAFDTSAGRFVIEVHRAWAPKGADRFYNLVKSGFYDEARFFRVVPGFVVQWGITGDPAVAREWRDATYRTTRRNRATPPATSRSPTPARTRARRSSSSTSRTTAPRPAGLRAVRQGRRGDGRRRR